MMDALAAMFLVACLFGHFAQKDHADCQSAVVFDWKAVNFVCVAIVAPTRESK